MCMLQVLFNCCHLLSNPCWYTANLTSYDLGHWGQFPIPWALTSYFFMKVSKVLLKNNSDMSVTRDYWHAFFHSTDSSWPHQKQRSTKERGVSVGLREPSFVTLGDNNESCRWHWKDSGHLGSAFENVVFLPVSFCIICGNGCHCGPWAKQGQYQSNTFEYWL